LPGYSRDSLEQCQQELARFSSSIPISVAGEAVEAIPRLFADLGIESPAARFAVETALLDIVAQEKGVPLWALLRGEGRGPPSPIALSSMIDATADAADRARAASNRGIRTLKMKVGREGQFERELETLQALRDLPNMTKMTLRADANGAWTPREARGRIEQLRPLDLEFIEEPCARDGWVELAGGGIPVAADESLQRDDGVDFAVARAHEGACSVFVLKPSALGGALRCLHIAELAHRAGAKVLVTHMFEGPIAHAASVELALALEPAPLACGLDSSPYASEWPRATLVRMTDCEAIPSASIGMGITSHWMESVS